ncbi:MULTISPECIES: response regulator transcription factor [Gordonibacter]|uniref:Response regulator transcription factor n=1 Tax=Gordonibacter faecis TaxID=3047475 RepID=A0ABT7DPK8_9ACTN|nr:MULTISPECIES: response regulator transcription factor [unclassified Gordonibacter]MDJ1651473.1 response regulator transcription factor [Gordonibacter sp. KGMB12511]HIW76065.1 response regulator transcription factor [Candidatus Gordonibacter avicola]
MYKVMLIDDEDNLHAAIEKLLVQSGYAFCGAKDGETGLALLADEKPDLLLLDVMLPGINGFDLCRRIREAGRRIPIIFLSAKTDIVDKSIGFKAGGDDYVTKPFNATELLLRIEANIRRHKDTLEFARCCNREGVARIGELEVHFDEYQVFVKGKPVPLTTKEFEIVAFLASNPGKVFTRSQIQEYIWGEGEADVKTNSITVFVRKIREKIEENPSEPKYLLTVQRVGYKMTDKVEG